MTKRRLAIAALASLSLAACDLPWSQPPGSRLASDPPTFYPQSAPQTPASSKLPSCVVLKRSHRLLCAKAPTFKQLERLAGEGPSNLDEAQDKIVVLVFCATFAPDCKKALPVYHAIAKEHPDRVAFIVLMMDTAETAGIEKALKEYASSLQINDSFVWDKKSDVATDYAIENVPTALVIDPERVIRAAHTDYQDDDKALLRWEIKELL